MKKIDDFFFERNTVNELSNDELCQLDDYLETVKALARTIYTSIYVIDYEKKGFDYVSDNPLFLCGNTAEEVQKMGYGYYLKYVIKEDIDLLLKINTAGFAFYDKIPFEERKKYTISYDFHIKNQENKVILINQKLTPLFLTKDGKIWKAICVVSLSSEKNSGNIRIYKKGSNEKYEFDLSEEVWRVGQKVELSDREKEILQLSSRGFTINEIADNIFITADTVKFHRKNLFEKLEVSNISEAINCAINNKLI
ncbi:LuxR C-terminal-related transcriptional regulator [Empedobacter stercoris]|uniref:helix-turn-helix transcriptional regulator n=1 Tax=Empedobacter stercoris TaxID=1628248 RepID=UPI0021B0310A|nr:LuxR family transcriptional regulator [Empedobacter stercoris]UWX66212.1 LuxR C-terminal-related transcriptional regulator [Empedobacter stercoris]